MPREFPVGTIRHWESGDVIKAHNPTPPYSGGWITLKTSSKFDGIGRECDMHARDVLNYKEPINGELCLDHEIDTFGEREGGQFFSKDNFKQYEGFYGAGRYSFRNEFSRLFMKNDMALQEAIHQAYVSTNEDHGGDKDHDVLSAEDKKQIRDVVKSQFKSTPTVITEEKALQLLAIVKRTQKQVEEGLDFKDPALQKVYDDFKKVADSLPETYELMSKKRVQKFEAVDSIETHFADNWGVRESCKNYIQKRFDEYVKKYADRISKDSLEEQIAQFGVSMDMPPDEFYSKIYVKAANQSYDYLEKYAGKEITLLNYGTPMRVKVFWGEQDYKKVLLFERPGDKKHMDLINWLNGQSYKLSPEYDEMNNGFKDLIYLRFIKKYGKTVEGDWALEHLPAIHNLENLINELPAGHFKTNEWLSMITNQDYNGGDRGGYAWYSAAENRINLSAKCVERSTIWGVLKNPTEFKSTLLHEIGHAVDKKIGGNQFYNYKKFVVDCGWTYASPELRAGMSATGEAKSIPRSGSNASTRLISNYASKSPSEAFAEYYSFYNLNKQAFDKFFETHDRKFLQSASKTIAQSVSSEQTIDHMLPNRVGMATLEHYNLYKTLRDQLSDRGKTHTITLNSPWHTSLSAEEKRKLKTHVIKLRKDYSINSMPPVIVVKNGADRHCIDGGTRLEVAKMNKQLVPSIEISKEQYYGLKEHGLKDEEIANCIYTQHANEFVPKQIAPAVEIRGLIYDDALIPLDVILENHDGLKTMQGICASKELEKALADMFGSN
jgi:hypothetical protein